MISSHVHMALQQAITIDVLSRAGAKAALPVLPGGVITPAQLTSLAKQIVSAVPQSNITLPSATSPRIVSPTPQRTQQRLSKQRRHQLATEDPIPSYALHPSGPSSGESHPFKSQLLSSAAVEHEHRPWLLLPGWEGYGNLADYCTVPRTGETTNKHHKEVTKELQLPIACVKSCRPVHARGVHQVHKFTNSGQMRMVHSCLQ